MDVIVDFVVVGHTYIDTVRIAKSLGFAINYYVKYSQNVRDCISKSLSLESSLMHTNDYYSEMGVIV